MTSIHNLLEYVNLRIWKFFIMTYFSSLFTEVDISKMVRHNSFLVQELESKKYRLYVILMAHALKMLDVFLFIVREKRKSPGN
jgi:hypothetical protein